MDTRRLLTNLTAAACVAAFAVSTSSADTIVLTSVDDNTLIEDPVGAYSCGAAQYFFAGRVGANGGNTLRRGALRFDLSAIPPGSQITSVSLRMYCSAAGVNTTYTVSLKRFLASWGEGSSTAFGGGGAPSAVNDVTWMHRFYPNTPWPAPGGQFSSTASVSRTVGAIGSYTWASTAQFVADVQDMVNNPGLNFGWCVQGNEVTPESVKRFDSHESGLAANRPQLTIVYTPGNRYDLTGDNKVNAADLAILLGAWGGGGAADVSGDGIVNGADLALLLGAWTG